MLWESRSEGESATAYCNLQTDRCLNSNNSVLTLLISMPGMRVAVPECCAVYGVWNTHKERGKSCYEKEESLAEESEKADRVLLMFKIQKAQIVSHPLGILLIQSIVMKYQHLQ